MGIDRSSVSRVSFLSIAFSIPSLTLSPLRPVLPLSDVNSLQVDCTVQFSGVSLLVSRLSFSSVEVRFFLATDEAPSICLPQVYSRLSRSTSSPNAIRQSGTRYEELVFFLLSIFRPLLILELISSFLHPPVRQLARHLQRHCCELHLPSFLFESKLDSGASRHRRSVVRNATERLSYFFLSLFLP